MSELVIRKDTKQEIEVNRVDEAHYIAISTWCGGVPILEYDALEHSKTFPAIIVPTPGGKVIAGEGDWVVKYSLGEYYVIQAHRFDALFEPIA